LAEIAPHRGRDHPADQVDVGEHRERQNKDDETDDDGQPGIGYGFLQVP
jgi:hypothetical protein